MASFPFHDAQYEMVPCNLCGETDAFKIVAKKDRYGLQTRTCLCRRCGLLFINPRMTPEWYRKFYEEGYRSEVAHVTGHNAYADLEPVFQLQDGYGFRLAQRLKPWVRPGLTIDVGSSIGGVLSGWQRALGGEVVGIEPSPREAAFANQKGIKTYVSLFEIFGAPLPPAANILSTRNLNHLLDPMRFLSWTHQQLQPDGSLVLAVQNFRLSAKRRGRMVPQIDHPYMFTPETLQALVQVAGFEIVFFENPEEVGPRGLEALRREGLSSHMRLVAKKIAAPPPVSREIPKGIARGVERSLRPLSIAFSYYTRYFPFILQKGLFRLHRKLKKLALIHPEP